MFRRDLPIERRRMLIGGFKRFGIGRENGMSAIREYRAGKEHGDRYARIDLRAVRSALKTGGR